MNQDDKAAYWKTNNRLILVLLLIWGAVSLGGGILFVESLNKIQFGGVPLGFWIAQQGSIYVFVILIFTYALVMDRLDKRVLDKESQNSIDQSGDTSAPSERGDQ